MSKLQPYRFLPILAWTIFLMFGVSGCSSYRQSSDLDISLADLKFSEATLTETTLDFVVRIENASPEPLRLQGAVHRLYINDLYLGKGMSGEPIEVPRFGSVTQPVKVHLSNLRMAGRIRQIVESQTVSYRLQSTVYGSHGRTLGSAREGTFRFADLQQH